MAVVVANGGLLKNPARSPLKILVPLNGTDVSRRGAEAAIAIARAANALVTVLYVSNLKPDMRAPRSSRLRRMGCAASAASASSSRIRNGPGSRSAG